jgi:hypothetical protein
MQSAVQSKRPENESVKQCCILENLSTVILKIIVLLVIRGERPVNIKGTPLSFFDTTGVEINIPFDVGLVCKISDCLSRIIIKTVQNDAKLKSVATLFTQFGLRRYK